MVNSSVPNSEENDIDAAVDAVVDDVVCRYESSWTAVDTPCYTTVRRHLDFARNTQNLLVGAVLDT